MNKSEFLSGLEDRLRGLPYEEIKKTTDYYSEMIDDAVENGEPYDEALKEAYTVIYQSKGAGYDVANYDGIDSCYYPDTPAARSVYFNRARKLLSEAVGN
ncbi:MAG: hypothetical protein LUF26_08340 [Firmicutes bacterium]|nr:hypothetical protein [Bacillota bacterium]